MNDIKSRIEALQKQMDAQRPNGGILIRLSDSWMAFSASTIQKSQSLQPRQKRGKHWLTANPF